MITKNLLTTITLAVVLLFSGCKNDDFNEINGICPAVAITNPDNLAIEVSLNQVISAKFNKKINPSTISETSFTVSENGTLIGGTVSHSDSTATFTPLSLLNENTEYTATIKSLVKDLKGNVLQEDYVWTFVTAPATQFSVTTSALPIAGGSANGSGSFVTGTNVTVIATPNSGYSFVNWTLAGVEVSTNSNYTFAINSNKTLVANFSAKTSAFTLNVTAQNGTVSKNPSNSTYNNGANVILTPTPNSGYVFDSWSGDATGNNNPLTVTMNSNKNITANFYLITAIGSYPAEINLGSAGAFAILGGSGVSNTGTTTLITGNVGSFPTATINGLLAPNVNGTLYTSADPIVGLAKTALTTAYNDAQARSLNAISLPGQLGGLTLAPGLYVNSSTSGISGTGANGILTLDAGGDANAVWVFKMGSALITSSGTTIVLAGGAKASNIFWSVGTSATLGTNSVFYGNILADQAITLTNGATLNGRALTRIAAVTLDSNIVTKP